VLVLVLVLVQVLVLVHVCLWGAAAGLEAIAAVVAAVTAATADRLCRASISHSLVRDGLHLLLLHCDLRMQAAPAV
jgi:hypothetical protein